VPAARWALQAVKARQQIGSRSVARQGPTVAAGNLGLERSFWLTVRSPSMWVGLSPRVAPGPNRVHTGRRHRDSWIGPAPGRVWERGSV